MMSKKINRSEYDIRTLAYYQRLGGIYNDIITKLVQMRDEAAHRGMPSPSQILNEASYYGDSGNVPADAVDGLVLCVMACLYSDDKVLLDSIKKRIETDTVYYPKFKAFMESLDGKTARENEHRHSRAQEEKVKELNEIIASQNETIADQSAAIYELQSTVKEMQARCALAETRSYDGSDFDRYLTLDRILQWIEGRHHYMYTEQVFRMLADMKDNVATDEERLKIQNLENNLLDRNQMQAVFNQNIGLGSNMMTGMVSSPQLPIGISPADFQKLFQQFIERLSHGER